MKTVKQIFEMIEEQGWHRLGFDKSYSLCFDFGLKHPIYFAGNNDYTAGDGCYFSIADLGYDKTPKNACQCLAEIKIGSTRKYSFKGLRKDNLSWVEFFEKEIRHDLLCNSGDGWIEKINNFLK